MLEQYRPYISMKAVLEDIHSMANSIEWDSDIMLEWANKGYRSLNLPAKFEDVIEFVEVNNHVGQFPDCMIHLNQMFYKREDEFNEEWLKKIGEITGITPNKPFYKWLPYSKEFHQRIFDLMRLSYHFRPLRRTGSVFGIIPCNQDVPQVGCHDLYSVEGCYFKTTFRKGCVVISYKKHVTDEDGLDMVPDNESLKMALFHFCMYRWFMQRMMMKEDGAGNIMNFHKQEFLTYSKKAKADLTSPDLDEMENIKNTMSRLVPRSNFYDRGFFNFSNREDIVF